MWSPLGGWWLKGNTYRVLANVLFLDLGDIALVLLILFLCMLHDPCLMTVCGIFFQQMVGQNSIYARVVIWFTFDIRICHVLLRFCKMPASQDWLFSPGGSAAFWYLSDKSSVFFVHLTLFCLITVGFIYNVVLLLHSLLLYKWRKKERLYLIERVIF